MYNLSESVAKNMPNINKIFEYLALKLKLSSAKRDSYISTTGLPLPESFSKTRWGKYLTCAAYIGANWDAIKLWINKENADKPEKDKLVYNDAGVKNEINLSQSYLIITESIEKLEAQGLAIEYQFETYYNVYRNLLLECDKRRFENILSKNVYFKTILMDYINLNKKPPEIFTYLECSNACVERIFSMYVIIYSQYRRRLTVESIFSFLLIIKSDVDIGADSEEENDDEI